MANPSAKYDFMAFSLCLPRVARGRIDGKC
jgi:hypothetical protein